MFETSADILNIIKAVSILSLAIFGSWAIYYFIRILKELFKIINETRLRLEKIDELIKSIKEKVEHSTSYLFLMSEGIKKILDVVSKYTGKKEDKKEEKE